MTVPTAPRAAVVLAVVVLAAVAGGATPAPAHGEAIQAPSRPDTVAAAAADSLVEAALAEGDVPGAVVVATREGRIVLARGYGVASLEEGRPMRGAETVLPVGSLAKPVTAAAALRLVEEGELDLDADLRDRTEELDLPLRHDAPFTLAHLLTHTAGFDDTDFGDAARSAGTARPLRPHLARRMPVQAFAPGRFHRYSNHGYALVGQLVQQAAGVGFAAHVKGQVFDPLGMTGSSMAQVPPDDLAARLATGYRERGGELRPVPRDYSNVAPADGLLTTGRDMGRFLVALTDTARRADLGGEVRQRMVETAFRYHDSLPGVTLAFRERPVNGREGLEHTGGRLGFSSQIVLVPDAAFGLFVTVDRRDSGVRSELTEQLLDLFLPSPGEPEVLDAGAAPAPVTDPDVLTGTYRSIRYNRRTLEKVAVLLGMVPRVTVEDRADGSLRIGGGRFFEVSPLLFRWERARWYNAFRVEAGEDPHLFSGHRAFEKVPWYENAGHHRILFAVGLLVLIVILALEGWESTLGGRSREAPPISPGGRWTRRLLVGASLALVGGIALLAVVLPELAATADYGAPPALRSALASIFAGAFLTAPLPVALGVGWTRGWWTPRSGLRLTAGSAAAVLLVLLLGYWNLIGFAY